VWEDGGLNGWEGDCSVSQAELPFGVKSDAGKGFMRSLECEASN
jgi:hypothetical protein